MTSLEIGASQVLGQGKMADAEEWLRWAEAQMEQEKRLQQTINEVNDYSRNRAGGRVAANATALAGEIKQIEDTRPQHSLFPETLSVIPVQDDEVWQERALCAQTDPEAFFPEKGGSTREAKRICTGCEVRDACLDYALKHQERFGIWGGLSERERRRLIRGII